MIKALRSVRKSISAGGSRSLHSERGQGLVEYALIIGIVSIGAVVALGFFSGRITGLFSKTGNSLNNVTLASGAVPGGGSLPGVVTPVTVPGGGSGVFAPPGNASGGGAGYTGMQGVYTNNPPNGTDTGDPCSVTVNGQTFTGVWVRHDDIPGPDSDWVVSGQQYDWACVQVPTNPPSGGSVSLAPTGPVTAGTELTATTSGWTNATYFDYEWDRNSSTNCGSGSYNEYNSNSSSSLTDIDTPSSGNRCYHVRVNARNAFGSSSSDPTSNNVLVNNPSPPSGGTVSLSPTGTANVGQVLTGSTSGWSNNPTDYTFEFQRGSGSSCATPGSWSTVDTDNVDAPTTSSTYTTSNGDGDSNHCFRVRVFATNGGGDSSTIVSTDLVFIQGPPSGGSVSVSPNGPVSGPTTLTATTSGWSGSPTGYTYTWQRTNTQGGGSGCNNSWNTFSGSTHSSANATDQLTNADNFCYRVVVTATNGLGTSSSTNSNQVRVN